jgi:hypothetical protein
MLRVVQTEQVKEMRRMEKQAIHFEARDKRKVIEKKRKELMERKIAELAAIAEWRNDCEGLRSEMEQAVQVTRDTWRNWLELREEAAEFEKDEVEVELELLKAKEEAHIKELETHGKKMNETDDEEKLLLADSLAMNEKLDRESMARREMLENARRKHAEFMRPKRTEA